MTTNTFYRLLKDGHPEHGMSPSSFTNPDDFTTDNKREVNYSFYVSDDESILSGVWECAPCRENIESYPAHEMMTVISGSVTLTDENGRAETYTAGDTFFVAKGTRCTWEITETLKKFYLISG